MTHRNDSAIPAYGDDGIVTLRATSRGISGEGGGQAVHPVAHAAAGAGKSKGTDPFHGELFVTVS